MYKEGKVQLDIHQTRSIQCIENSKEYVLINKPSAHGIRKESPQSSSALSYLLGSEVTKLLLSLEGVSLRSCADQSSLALVVSASSPALADFCPSDPPEIQKTLDVSMRLNVWTSNLQISFRRTIASIFQKAGPLIKLL